MDASMLNKKSRWAFPCIFWAALGSAVFMILGCRQSQPEVRSLLSFSETWNAARNSDRLFCQYAYKVAEETDSAREKLFAHFLASNRVSEVVMLLEYANPINLREYRMIVVTKRCAYHLSHFEYGKILMCHLDVLDSELTEVRKSIGVLYGYQSERVTLGSQLNVVFVTLYTKQKAGAMFFSEMPKLGLKRAFGSSKNPQYSTFCRLLDILLLAKGKDGVVPEFKIGRA